MVIERVRLTVDVSARLNRELDEHAKARGSTKQGILILGLQGLFSAHKAQEEGMTVGAWKTPITGHRIEREFVGLP